MQKLITIARFNTPAEAHIARGRLLEEGITAFIEHEHSGSIPEITGNFLGGVLLKVPEDSEESALFILNRDFSPPGDS